MFHFIQHLYKRFVRLVSHSCKISSNDSKVLGQIRKTQVVEDTLTMQEDIIKVVAWTCQSGSVQMYCSDFK